MFVGGVGADLGDVVGFDGQVGQRLRVAVPGADPAGGQWLRPGVGGGALPALAWPGQLRRELGGPCGGQRTGAGDEPELPLGVEAAK